MIEANVEGSREPVPRFVYFLLFGQCSNIQYSRSALKSSQGNSQDLKPWRRSWSDDCSINCGCEMGAMVHSSSLPLRGSQGGSSKCWIDKENAIFLLQLTLLFLLDCLDPRLDVQNASDFPRIGDLRLACLSPKYYRHSTWGSDYFDCDYFHISRHLRQYVIIFSDSYDFLTFDTIVPSSHCKTWYYSRQID